MSLCFSSYNEAYQTMFAEYKDIVSVKEASIMLNTGRKQIYKLLKQGKLDKLEHNAKGFLITKRSIVAYVLNSSQKYLHKAAPPVFRRHTCFKIAVNLFNAAL